MPELPEVEAARRAIEAHCVGKKIVKSKIADDPKVIDGVSVKDFEASLNGKTIVAAHRKGKNMWLQLDSPSFPSFQFGMAGAVYIKGVAVTKYKRSAVKDTDEWPSKYSKFFIELDDGLELSFTDKRRFAKVRLLDNPSAKPPISELGPDALLEPMTPDGFHKSVSKKNTGIKALLLDQSFISGIGNWIADEVLYQARIHPLQTVSSMSKENCQTLLNSIKEVVQFAVEVDADSCRFPPQWMFHFRWGKKPGNVIEKAVEVGADSSEFPDNWVFHSREKKPGKAFVDGKKIEFINAGGRTTAYVPELQKLIGAQAGKAVVKPAKTSSKRTKKNTGDDDDDEVDPVSEEETKPKERTNNRKKAIEKKKIDGNSSDGGKDDEDGGKKTEGNDDDDDDGKKAVSGKAASRKKSKAKDDVEKKEVTRKNPVRKRKIAAAEEDINEADDNNGDEKDSSEEREEVEESKKKVESKQNSRQRKKKAN